MNTIRLWVPVLPDPDLSSNKRRTRAWQAQARDTATERERAYAMLREATLWEPWDIFPIPAALHWTIHWPKGTRARDADSLASMLKSWQDAMVDLGWLQNDSPKYVPTVSYTSVPSSPRGPGMELEIKSTNL